MVILHLFVYIQFIIHFMLLALIYAHLGACPSVLAWLTLASAKQARTNPHATVFLQGQYMTYKVALKSCYVSLSTVLVQVLDI